MIIQTFRFVWGVASDKDEYLVELGVHEHPHLQVNDPSRSDWCLAILEDVVNGFTTEEDLQNDRVAIRIISGQGSILVDTLGR